jgi:hypothetical protein
MNTAYGEPNAESLPFDLRHLRWPRTYQLTEEFDTTDKKDQFEKLVRTLAKDIGLILSNHSSPILPVEKFVPQKSTNDAAVFFNTVADLIGDRSGSFAVPHGAKAYLRLYPSVANPPINSELEARNLATYGNLQPMGRARGWGFDRNIFGAIAHEPPEDGKLYHFTQLFLSREIWGVDARVLNADHIREQLQQWVQNDSIRYIANGYIEEYFVKALQNYLAFAQKHLQLTYPFKIEAGLVGIKGYALATRNNHIAGKALQDSICWQSEILSDEKPAWEILAPFFNRIWDNCGFQRPAEQQSALAKGFGG